ncbi:MAG: RluA family pseudouridine synthase [Prevotella sp.]|nr:RluA family pseudouridine synthase [Prevotella sp.]
MMLHHLHTRLLPPERMNNPFRYSAHPLCQLAVKGVLELLSRNSGEDDWTAFCHEVALGKMFGVLVVRAGDGSLAYLAAYSGQVCGRSNWEGFVPAVFDYLGEGDYFKTHEAAITELNRRVAALEHSTERQQLQAELQRLDEEARAAVAALKAQKPTPNPSPGRGTLSAPSNTLTLVPSNPRTLSPSNLLTPAPSNIRLSQFLNAEIRRTKKRYAAQKEERQQRLQQIDSEIARLKHERHIQSDALQRWLFSHFEMLNARGEKKNLLEIFSSTVFKQPPAGAGECCEPKLLQYAFAHGLHPLCMAMFWYGQSPRCEIRHHLHYYPACSGKCKPILEWMLQGLDVDPLTPSHPLTLSPSHPLTPGAKAALLQQITIYEDEWLLVVNKPAGMLSVPGKSGQWSVFDLVRSERPQATGPLMVHRLDQATSGLLLVAKTTEVYHTLQAQFLHREVKKRYVALLSHEVTTCSHVTVISLPLRPDPLNRPFQVVDHEGGKPAVTRVEWLGGRRVALYPLTGRTHQLRVHCAHPEGLGNPILGDELYGKAGERLYLHAEHIEFVHPMSGQPLLFSIPPEF